jgi:hypothetical protein
MEVLQTFVTAWMGMALRTIHGFVHACSVWLISGSFLQAELPEEGN